MVYPASGDRNAMNADGTVNKTALSKTLAHFNKMNLVMFSSFQASVNAKPRTSAIHLLHIGSYSNKSLLHENYTAAVALRFENIIGRPPIASSPSLDASNGNPGRWQKAANYAIQFEKKVSAIVEMNRDWAYNPRSLRRLQP